MTKISDICDLCGGDLPNHRVIVGGMKFHVTCSHDGRDHRIEELEIALKVIIGHWDEFGPEEDFAETIEIARRVVSKIQRA